MDENGTMTGEAADPESQTSQRRIDANRRNAQRSTGPRTAAGKVRSARNSLRNGLNMRLPEPLEGPPYRETPEQVNEMLTHLLVDWDPQTVLERAAVMTLGSTVLRLSRLRQLEEIVQNEAGNRKPIDIDALVMDLQHKLPKEPLEMLVNFIEGQRKSVEQADPFARVRTAQDVVASVARFRGWPDSYQRASVVDLHLFAQFMRTSASDRGIRGVWDKKVTPETDQQWRHAIIQFRRIHWPDETAWNQLLDVSHRAATIALRAAEVELDRHTARIILDSRWGDIRSQTITEERSLQRQTLYLQMLQSTRRTSSPRTTT